jgi:hypothetical protein
MATRMLATSSSRGRFDEALESVPTIGYESDGGTARLRRVLRMGRRKNEKLDFAWLCGGFCRGDGTGEWVWI